MIIWNIHSSLKNKILKNMKSLIEKMFIKLNYPKIVRGGRFCIAVPSDITEVEKRAFYDV